MLSMQFCFVGRDTGISQECHAEMLAQARISNLTGLLRSKQLTS